MKKLIAISVVFALIAVAAFAQPNMGGQVKAGVTLVGGGGGGDPETGGRSPDGYTVGVINARAGDENVGGFVRAFSRSGNDTVHHTPDAFAFAWWKPIDQLRLQFGNNPDGDFGSAKITGWGYNAEAQDFVALDQWSGPNLNDYTTLIGCRTFGFQGGKNSDHALAVSILPMDGLAINIFIPFGTKTSPVQNVYLSSMFQVTYAIAGTGQLSISYDGKGLNAAEDSLGGDLFVSFYFTMVENLGLDLGLNYTLAPKGGDALPIKIGLGAKYDMGDFGLKARIGASLAGKDKMTIISVGLLPYYNLGSLTAFLNIGFGLTKPDSGDGFMDWYVNPYIAVPAGGAKFFAGIRLLGVDKDRGKYDGVKWDIPIGLNYYF